MLSDPRLPNRGEFAKALRYMRNQAQRLTLFLRDGQVFIHNAVELASPTIGGGLAQIGDRT